MVSKPAISRPIDLDQQLAGREAIAGFLGADQLREQVVREASAARLDQLLEVERQIARRRHAALHDLRGRELRGEQVRRVAGPGGEARPILERNAHHLADHRRGDRQREIGDHVHLAARERRVEQAAHVGAHALAKPLDRPRREGLAHQPAQARVIGRILLEHELAGARGEAGRRRSDRRRAVGVADAALHLAQQPDAVVVARETPGADRREVNRRDLAQPPQGGRGVVAKRGIGRVGAQPGVARVDAEPPGGGEIDAARGRRGQSGSGCGHAGLPGRARLRR